MNFGSSDEVLIPISESEFSLFQNLLRESRQKLSANTSIKDNSHSQMNSNISKIEQKVDEKSSATESKLEHIEKDQEKKKIDLFPSHSTFYRGLSVTSWIPRTTKGILLGL